ncbi:MAG: hypothetical protein ACJ77M_19425 [Thermoleophilaceae bacterium]|jgi:hypothetical protein
MARLPADPAAFVASAAPAYAPDALVEIDALPDAEVRRTLVSATGDTVVDEWEGGGNKGIEYWRFNSDGLVYEHRAYGHLDVEPPPGLRERARMMLAHPRAALGLLRQRHRD